MIRINFDPSSLTGDEKSWWDNWQAEAVEATKKLIKGWEDTGKLEFDEEVWCKLKVWLLDKKLHGKCAYCETNIDTSRASGHAEHYRPKGGVKYRQAKKKRLTTATGEDQNGQPKDHPGYFWLAYHWRNLLPSCQMCNSGRGKNNQFPVDQRHVLLKRLAPAQAGMMHAAPRQSEKWQDIYYLQPEDLDELEKPLLLHPYLDDPEEHLLFGACGIEAAKEIAPGVRSPKGEQSIEVYDLKDDDLRRARQKAQNDAITTFYLAYTTELRKGRTPADSRRAAWEAVADVKQGKTEYSAAALDFIEESARSLVQPGF